MINSGGSTLSHETPRQSGARWVGGGEKRWKEGDACGGGPGGAMEVMAPHSHAFNIGGLPHGRSSLHYIIRFMCVQTHDLKKNDKALFDTKLKQTKKEQFSVWFIEKY